MKKIIIKTSFSIIACSSFLSCTYKKHNGITPIVPVANHWRPKQIDKGIISPQTS